MLVCGEMPMIAVFAFVDIEVSTSLVFVFGDASGELGFFAGIVDNFVSIANPTTSRFVDPIWI